MGLQLIEPLEDRLEIRSVFIFKLPALVHDGVDGGRAVGGLCQAVSLQQVIAQLLPVHIVKRLRLAEGEHFW